MKIGIALTANDRPNYFTQTVDSWLNVRGFQDIPPLDKWVFIEPSLVVSDMESEGHRLGAKVHSNANKLGVLLNPWVALDNMFKPRTTGCREEVNYYSGPCDFVILAEDDILVSSDVLEYFAWAAEAFEDDASVLTVNAFSREGGEKDLVTKRDGFASPLIWGTWIDRWRDIIRDTWDKNYTFNGWDWHLDAIAKENGMKSVMPLQSRSDHIGEFGGTHMTPEHVDTARGIGFVPCLDKCNYKLI